MKIGRKVEGREGRREGRRKGERKGERKGGRKEGRRMYVIVCVIKNQSKTVVTLFLLLNIITITIKFSADSHPDYRRIHVKRFQTIDGGAKGQTVV